MNNFNNNNQYYNQQMGSMYQQQQNRQRPVLTNPLSPDIQKEKMNKQSAFSLLVTQDELNDAVCTHKDTINQNFSIIPNEDGTIDCKICHAHIDPRGINTESVKRIANDFINVLQCIKLYGVGISPEAIEQFMAMIPFVSKTPQLYEIAMDSYSKYMGTNTGVNPQYSNGGNPFNILNNIVGGGTGVYNPNMIPNNPAQYGYSNNYYPYMNQAQPQYNTFNGAPQQQPNGQNPFYANMGGVNYNQQPQPTYNMQGQPIVNQQQAPMQQAPNVGVPEPKNSSVAQQQVQQNMNPAPDVVQKTAQFEV